MREGVRQPALPKGRRTCLAFRNGTLTICSWRATDSPFRWWIWCLASWWPNYDPPISSFPAWVRLCKSGKRKAMRSLRCCRSNWRLSFRRKTGSSRLEVKDVYEHSVGVDPKSKHDQVRRRSAAASFRSRQFHQPRGGAGKVPACRKADGNRRGYGCDDRDELRHHHQRRSRRLG